MKKPASLDKADIKAFLGPGSRFEGKLNFDEMVRIDGSFSGEIHSSDTLMVGESAVIEGQIRVGALILSGSFSGEITATSLVELRAPAKVEGKIETPSLKIEENVVFNGEIFMTTDKETDRPANTKNNKAEDKNQVKKEV